MVVLNVLVVLSSSMTKEQMACQRVIEQRVLLVTALEIVVLGSRPAITPIYISCSGLDGPLGTLILSKRKNRGKREN